MKKIDAVGQACPMPVILTKTGFEGEQRGGHTHQRRQ